MAESEQYNTKQSRPRTRTQRKNMVRGMVPALKADEVFIPIRYKRKITNKSYTDFNVTDFVDKSFLGADPSGWLLTGRSWTPYRSLSVSPRALPWDRFFSSRI